MIFLSDKFKKLLENFASLGKIPTFALLLRMWRNW